MAQLGTIVTGQIVSGQQYTLVFLGYVIIVANDVLPSYTLLPTCC
jgi:hypothetical protein